MSFYELLNAVEQKIRQQKEEKGQSLYLLSDFKLMLREKFLPYVTDQTVITEPIKPKLASLLEEMMNMFSKIEVRTIPDFSLIDPFTTAYADPNLQAIQKRLRILFKETLIILSIELRIDDISEKTNICTDAVHILDIWCLLH